MEESRPVWLYQHPSHWDTWKEFPPKILNEVEAAFQDYYKHGGEPTIQIRIGRGKRQTTAIIDFDRMQQLPRNKIIRDIRRLLEPWVRRPMALGAPRGA